jgi:hypothetical protein
MSHDEVFFDEDQQTYTFLCPHCQCLIQVPNTQINCTIFRHAVYNHNYKQIPPHSTKEVCDDLFMNGKIFGCGKPFLFDGITVVKTNTYN